MKITKDNYKEVKKAMLDFLISEVEKYAEIAGGKSNLSKKLGKSETFITMTIKRDSIAPLESIIEECRKIYRG